MMNPSTQTFVVKTRLLLFALLFLSISQLSAQSGIQLSPLGTYSSGIFDDAGAEISAYDFLSRRLFVVNGGDGAIDVLDIRNPQNPTKLFSIDTSPYGAAPNSVAVWFGLVAVAVENDDKQLPGKVVFFNRNGQYLKDVTVGALPDMLTFTWNGQYVLVANEGEPNDDYTIDPEGSVSIISLKRGIQNLTQHDVKTADFRRFNNAHIDPRIRIFGPNASVAQDLEPEYITVDYFSRKAWVSLQDNNAIAEIDIRRGKITKLFALGTKDHSLPGNGLDASNRDAGINIQNWPVKGMYQPDAIAFYRAYGKKLLVTANEGDSREYEGNPGFVDEDRIDDFNLDPTAFPNASVLQEDENLGRLKATITEGDIDNDGDYDELYSYGARSFSIWDTRGNQLFDSGDDFEQITAAAYPDDFNSTNDENDSFDNRSDDKGPEPEGVAIGYVNGRQYAFIGLERMGGIMVYDISNPYRPNFIQYINNRDFAGDAEAGTAGDLAPEGILFIPRWLSPNFKPLLVVANEVSGTTTIYEINDASSSANNSSSKVAEVPSLRLNNYPNPFSDKTLIEFELPEAGQTSLEIYDLQGRKLKSLINAELTAGQHQVKWSGTDEAGNALPSGAYLYRLQSNGFIQLKKLIIAR
ncbi:MAG: choice-of-anchor I family protein [Bacteroidota bacterium]